MRVSEAVFAQVCSVVSMNQISSRYVYAPPTFVLRIRMFSLLVMSAVTSLSVKGEVRVVEGCEV